jgi:hypothetical protein
MPPPPARPLTPHTLHPPQATGNAVKTGLEVVGAGVNLLKQGYEVAAPVIKQGVDAVTPAVVEAVKVTSEAAAPVVQKATPVVQVGGGRCAAARDPDGRERWKGTSSSSSRRMRRRGTGEAGACATVVLTLCASSHHHNPLPLHSFCSRPLLLPTIKQHHACGRFRLLPPPPDHYPLLTTTTTTTPPPAAAPPPPPLCRRPCSL